MHNKVTLAVDSSEWYTSSEPVTNSQLTNSDRTYDPEMDTDCECTTTQTATDDTTELDILTQQKYLVFGRQLDLLFKHCPVCSSNIVNLQKTLSGSLLTVTYTCQYHHTNNWSSQPTIRRMAAGNLLLSAATLLTGNTYAKINSFLSLLNVPFIGESQFFSHQRNYLLPAVNNYWIQHQTAVLSVLSANDQVVLCGDGRSDSPGHNATYCSYTVMDTATSIILDQQLVQVTEEGVTSSVAMEKVALERSLNFLISYGIQIDTLATDRHPAVKSLLSKNFPDIKHQFDVWHVAKNITKKLAEKAKKKNATELVPWIRSVSNHLYWSAQSCGGDPQLLKEKWMSCIHHIVNRHEWPGGLMTRCEHEPYDDSDSDDTIAWLTVDSEAHTALKKVVLDKRLLTDIPKLSDFRHTGQLEVYHSMLLKYAPKRQFFGQGGMQARLQLAALDWNMNADRQIAKDSSGNPIIRQIFSKPHKHWILRNEYEKKDYGYLQDILLDIIDLRQNESGDTDLNLPPIKPNISTTAKPTFEEAIKNRCSRMKK